MVKNSTFATDNTCSGYLAQKSERHLQLLPLTERLMKSNEKTDKI